MALKSINPATEDVLETYQPHTDKDVEQALARAEARFDQYRTTSFDQRAVWLKKAAEILRARKDEWAKLLTLEMGKPITAARGEVEKCAWVCDYYAENAEQHLADRRVQTEATQAYVCYLPIGPVLAVMPWNFPFWQVFRFAAPALMAGNIGLLKHASNVPGAAIAIERIFLEAGFPENAFKSLLIGSDKVENVIRDDRVRAVTLTGSEPAGRAVASQAGSEIKTTVLELGGSDAFIVMPSADIEAAAQAAVKGRTLNNGQSCIAAKRFIVHEEVYDRFSREMRTRLEAMKIGDPMDEETEIGPLALNNIRKELDEQVCQSVEQGAKRVTGAEIIEGRGYFYRPGMLEAIPQGAPADNQELFGPVASMFKVANFDEALTKANDSRFGLGSAVFTQDQTEVERSIRYLDAGATFINSVTASDPRLPFGGVKASGYGRELAQEGIREFVNVKAVSIA